MLRRTLRRTLWLAIGIALSVPAVAGLISITGSRGSPPTTSTDWFSTESQRSGVVVSNRLEMQAIIDDWKLSDVTGDHMVLDTTLKPSGSIASLKHLILSSDGTASGQFSVPFGTNFGNGSTVVFAYQVYFQPQDKYAPWAPGSPSDDLGAKLSILSRDANDSSCTPQPGCTGSNQVNEFVFQLNYNGGRISAYHRDTMANFPPISVGSSNACSGTDIIDTPDLNRGTSSPLTGTNPDSGAAWTSCQQFRAQFAALHYSARSSPGAANYALGLGDPFSVDYAPPGEWITVQGALVIGAFGGGDNDTRAIGMVARENGPWVLLFDRMIDLGSNTQSPPGYTALNLLPYVSARTSGGRQVSSRGGELAGCFTVWNVSPNHATGAGTLAWNASTQRLSWQASGDSAGTARGYSAANNILAVNLISSTAANFVNGKFTPSGCPGSNTTETVTIGANRPDTQRNYANVIIATSLRNAPDGSAPPVTLP